LTPEYLQRFLKEDESLPVPDAVFGFDDDETEGDAPTELPDLKELLKDPDVQAMLKAFKELEPVAS
jgi:hypothetical protein